MNEVYFDSFIGGANTESEIATQNSDLTKLFTVKNSYTYPVDVLGIQTRFKDGLADCTINFKDGDGNEILSGNPQLANIGNSFTAAVPFATDLLPVNFVLPAGNEIYVYVSNKTQPVGKRDISILFCVRRKRSQQGPGNNVQVIRPQQQAASRQPLRRA